MARLQAAVVFALALLVRGLHFRDMQQSPLFSVLLGDAWKYDQWAQTIAGGDVIGTDVFYQTPLYPYLLGGLYAAFGHDPWVIRFVQAVFGALACAFLANTGTRLFPTRVGWLAGVLLALYPPAIFFDGILQKASLDLLLMTALLWLIARTQERPKAARLFGAGALLGAMILNRENAAALLPLLLGWALWLAPVRGSLRAAVFSGMLVAGVGVVLLPVGLRNRAVGGEFLLTTSQLGPNFYIGNHRGADGGYTPMRAGRGEANFERDDARLIAEDDLERPLGPSEVSRYWLSRAFADIRSAPFEWGKLLLWKWLLTWNRVELVDVEAIHTHELESRPLGILGVALHFGVLCPLAVLGVWWTRRDWRSLWLLYGMALTFALAVTAFYVFARYRYPLAPIAVLFAGAGLDGLYQRARLPRAADRREVLIGLGLGALAAVLCNWRVPQIYADDAITYYNAGTILLDQGATAEALSLLEKARAADPEFPETYNNLGRARMDGGDLDGARRDLERGIELAPDHAFLHYNLAVVVARQGDAQRTRTLLARAVALDPLLVRAYGPLAELELRAGDADAAIRHLRRAVALEPGSARAHVDLAVSLAFQGRAREAAETLRMALRLDPGLVPARNRLAWLLATTADPTLRDGRAALALAEESCPGAGCTDPLLLQTLAAAHAAAGQRDEAVAVAERGVLRARETGQAELARRLESERALYWEGGALWTGAASP